MKESVSQTRDSRVLPVNPKSSAVISDNRASFVSMKKQVSLINQGNKHSIQKRDPTPVVYNGRMTHGTAIKEFMTGKKIGGFGATNDKTKPSAPAWMAPGTGKGDEKFSILAALAMHGYGGLNIGETEPLYVHNYRMRFFTKLSLNQWEKWNYVPEYLYRQPGVVKGPNYAKHPGEDKEKVAMNYATKHPEDKFDWNTREAAEAIKKADPGKDGYRIEEDLVLNKPEIILFEKGLGKIKKSERQEYLVAKLGDKNFQVAPAAGGGKTYKWNGEFELI